MLSRVVLALALAGIASISSAQDRGSIPLGESRDESRPAEGAIRGGSIEPDISTSPAPERDIVRCKELRGELREQCLRALGAGAGGSAPPEPAGPVQRDPTIEPPPQNPRAPR